MVLSSGCSFDWHISVQGLGCSSRRWQTCSCRGFIWFFMLVCTWISCSVSGFTCCLVSGHVCSYVRCSTTTSSILCCSLLSLSNLKSVLNGKSLRGIRIMAVRAAVLNASSPESTWEEKPLEGFFSTSVQQAQSCQRVFLTSHPSNWRLWPLCSSGETCFPEAEMWNDPSV